MKKSEDNSFKKKSLRIMSQTPPLLFTIFFLENLETNLNKTNLKQNYINLNQNELYFTFKSLL